MHRFLRGQTSSLWDGAVTMRRDQHCKERVERIFTPQWDRLVQWLRVLKLINSEYANIEILGLHPLNSLIFQVPCLKIWRYVSYVSMSMCDHPDLIAAEN